MPNAGIFGRCDFYLFGALLLTRLIYYTVPFRVEAPAPGGNEGGLELEAVPDVLELEDGFAQEDALIALGPATQQQLSNSAHFFSTTAPRDTPLGHLRDTYNLGKASRALSGLREYRRVTPNRVPAILPATRMA